MLVSLPSHLPTPAETKDQMNKPGESVFRVEHMTGRPSDESAVLVLRQKEPRSPLSRWGAGSDVLGWASSQGGRRAPSLEGMSQRTELMGEQGG